MPLSFLTQKVVFFPLKPKKKLIVWPQFFFEMSFSFKFNAFFSIANFAEKWISRCVEQKFRCLLTFRRRRTLARGNLHSVTLCLPPVPGIDLNEYIDCLMRRLRNDNVVCGTQRLLPPPYSSYRFPYSDPVKFPLEKSPKKFGSPHLSPKNQSLFAKKPTFSCAYYKPNIQ